MRNSSTQIRKLLVTFVITLLVMSAFAISGFTVATLDQPNVRQLPPGQRPAGDGEDTLPDTGAGDDENGDEDSSEPVDLIKNGDFEEPFVAGTGVAPQWEGFRNGRAHSEWYEELWPEAVRTGERAQLMEIFQVEPNVLDRVVAIYQTVDVASNATYDLTINAIMRSQVQPADRNKNEFEMAWGVDFSGEGEYDNVDEWNLMPLEEQFRLGSNGEFPDDRPLFYETITGTIPTGESNRITLFIRGLKKFPTGAEVNFDVDDVSLVGPKPGVVVIITPEPDDSPADEEDNLPMTGAILPESFSVGALSLGALVLVVLGGTAVANLLQDRKDR